VKVNHCKSCGAEIIWAVTGSGARTPLDAENIGRVVVLEPPEAPDGPPTALVRVAYRSHFATCPNAKEHRR
jgi:hypothetical protein